MSIHLCSDAFALSDNVYDILGCRQAKDFCPRPSSILPGVNDSWDCLSHSLKCFFVFLGEAASHPSINVFPFSVNHGNTTAYTLAESGLQYSPKEPECVVSGGAALSKETQEFLTLALVTIFQGAISSSQVGLKLTNGTQVVV